MLRGVNCKHIYDIVQSTIPFACRTRMSCPVKYKSEDMGLPLS